MGILPDIRVHKGSTRGIFPETSIARAAHLSVDDGRISFAALLTTEEITHVLDYSACHRNRRRHGNQLLCLRRYLRRLNKTGHRVSAGGPSFWNHRENPGPWRRGRRRLPAME